MVKKIEICGKECTFKSSAAIPRLYRIKFQRDLFADMQSVINEAKSNKEMSIASLEAFEKASDGKATKIIIPSNIQGVAGLATSIKELVKNGD